MLRSPALAPCVCPAGPEVLERASGRQALPLRMPRVKQPEPVGPVFAAASPAAAGASWRARGWPVARRAAAPRRSLLAIRTHRAASGRTARMNSLELV